LDSQVTTTQIIVAASAVVASAVAVGGLVWGLSKSMTEFRLGITSLTEALRGVGETMKEGFSNVEARMEKGESRMSKVESRVLRVELANNIDYLEHNG
jgi:predicted Co/Zn/Cd cation transporter (cation efflux family)